MGLLSGYRMGRKLSKYYTEKYGKHFIDNVEKYDKIIYIIHCVISLILIIMASSIRIYSLMFFYAIEMLVVVVLSLHPHFMVPKLYSLPIFGMTIYLISFTCLLQINKKSSLDFNINYLSNVITATASCIFSLLLIITYKKEELKRIQNIQEIKNLKFKVTEKIPIDYDYSFVFFEGDNGDRYVIKTDLDEKFNEGILYRLKDIKNENMIIESVNIHNKEVYFIDKIDASKFYQIL